MFGTLESPTFHLHGGETNGILRFSIWFLERHRDKFGAHRPVNLFLEVARDLVRVMDLIKMFAMRFPPAFHEEFVACTHRIVTNMPIIGVHAVPKTHQLVEMAYRTPFLFLFI